MKTPLKYIGKLITPPATDFRWERSEEVKPNQKCGVSLNSNSLLTHLVTPTGKEANPEIPVSYALEEGDIVISLVSGRQILVALLDHTPEQPLFLTRNMLAIRIDKTKADPKSIFCQILVLRNNFYPYVREGILTSFDTQAILRIPLEPYIPDKRLTSCIELMRSTAKLVECRNKQIELLKALPTSVAVDIVKKFDESLAVTQ